MHGVGELPFAFYRWKLAEQFGWSLHQIDNLSMADYHEYLQIEDAKIKVRNKAAKGKK